MSKIVTNKGDMMNEALIKHVISKMRGSPGDPEALAAEKDSLKLEKQATLDKGKRKRKKVYHTSLEDI
jgi:hypothetical protein